MPGRVEVLSSSTSSLASCASDDAAAAEERHATQAPVEAVTDVHADGAHDSAALEPDSRVDLVECARLKQKGNELFVQGNIPDALASYREALKRAPIKPPPPPPDVHLEDDNKGKKAMTAEAKDTVEKDAMKEDQAAPAPPASPTAAADTTDYTLTAQVLCNAGYCLMKLRLMQEAEEMLAEAIRHDAGYVKAYLRHADCCYELQKWSAAFGDYESYEKLGGRLDADGRGRKQTAKAKMDEEMKKMLGELKDVGNKFLGMFGLSVDNFKFDKDPNTGGYSMRFER